MLTVGLDATSLLHKEPGGIQRFIKNLLERTAIGGLEQSEDVDVRPMYRLSRFRDRYLRHGATLGRARWFTDPPTRRHRYDIAHGLNSRIAGRVGKKQVVALHDVFSLTISEHISKRHIKRCTERYKRIADQADMIVCISEYTRDKCVELIGVERERTRVIYLAADERFRPDAANADVEAPWIDDKLKQPYLLFLGPWSANKNPEQLVAAFARSSLRNDMQLVIAGRMDTRSAQIAECLEANKVSDSVDLIGCVPDEFVPRLYAGASAVCIPSLDEGFGIPVLESLASGVPLACSNRGALPEVAGGHAELFDPLDADSIAAALERAAAKDPEARERALRHARTFSWDRNAREHLALWNELAD